MNTVVTFEIPHTQLLNAKGEATGTLPEFAQDIKTLLELYRIMVLTRHFDKKGIALQRTGKMGTYASSYGQEAIGAALGYLMQKDDVLVPSYREYAAQLQRGVSMSDIYSYWGGDERGNCFANGNQDLSIAVPIASQCLHAAGLATAFKIRDEKRVAVSCCGDGGTSEGDFYEALNVAGAWKLPVVFIVSNNQWAISVPRNKQSACETLAQKAIAAGFSGEQVDGNDVLAIYHVLQQALDKARNEQQPTLIEALTYRLGDHTTADDAGRYRSASELQQAEQLEPIQRFKQFIINAGHWSEKKEQALLEECHQSIEKAVDDYVNRPAQNITALFDYHYQDLPDALQEQRQQAIEETNNA